MPTRAPIALVRMRRMDSSRLLRTLFVSTLQSSKIGIATCTKDWLLVKTRLVLMEV